MLDSLWGTGPSWLAREQAIAQAVARIWRGDVHRVPRGPARVDAIFTRDGELLSIAEIRARSETLAGLRARDGYLITHTKVQRGRDTGIALGVPFDLLIGFGDGAIGWFRISEGDGTWRTHFTVRTTKTQAGCNGGTATRPNAFLDWRDLHVLRPGVKRSA